MPESTAMALHWLKHEINTSADPNSSPSTSPPIPAMAIALNFPIRWRCTSLAWQALHSGLTAGTQIS